MITADELRAAMERQVRDAETGITLASSWANRGEEAMRDRGALIDHMRALAQPVPYRPGLPTVEQVRAHHHRTWPGEPDPWAALEAFK